jgi:uncharacterized protein (UPF0210 family)
MINKTEILETIRMIEEQKLDIRTITMGITLLDCSHPDPATARQKIYDKITRKAERLVQVGQEIETEFGIPIINKRISVTPISLVAAASDTSNYVGFARTLDQAAQKWELILLEVFPLWFIKDTQQATKS